MKRDLATLIMGMGAGIGVGMGLLGYPPAAIAQTTATPESIEQLAHTEWLLEDLGGRGVVDNVQTTIRFEEDDRITGSGGCNRYFADIEQEGDRLSIGTIGSTQMMCPPAIMDQEDRYFQALNSALTIWLDGPFLYIESQVTDTPLRFTQILPPTAEESTPEAEGTPNAEEIVPDTEQGTPDAVTTPPGTIQFADTLQLFHGGDYAVRIFQRGDALAMNLYNTRTATLELNGVTVERIPNTEGTDFLYVGDRTVKVFVATYGEQQLVIDGEWQRDPDSPTAMTIEGTVTYLPRIALSPNAVLEVRLLDVSRQDAPAEMLAAVTIPTAGQQVPLPFQLAYNPNQIMPQHTYSIQARILVDGELQFISTTHNPVFGPEAEEEIEILVDPI